MRRRLVSVPVLLLAVCLFQGVLVTYYIFSQDEDDSHKVEDGKNQQLALFTFHPAAPNQQNKELKSTLSSPQKFLDQKPRRIPPKAAAQVTNLSSSQSTDPCLDEICSNYLILGSFESYKYCESIAAQKTLVSPNNIPKRCKFRDGRGLDPVALVSVPGSGNTWVRGLLEKATGICTGSIYCDESLRSGGFIGEYVKTSSVLVVKTHTSDFQWRYRSVEKRNIQDTFYGSAILLIRNPFDTFVSERHRSILLERADAKLLAEERLHGAGQAVVDDSSHVDQISKEEFGNSTDWQQFVSAISTRWQKTILKWSLSSNPGSLLVLHYEDLKKDSVREVKRMLDFLHQDYNDTELSAALKGGFSGFRRHHGAWEKAGFQYYTPEQKDRVNKMILETIEILKANKFDHLFKIQEYLL